MPRTQDAKAGARIAELEDELQQRNGLITSAVDKVRQLTTELGEARELADRMREHVEDVDRLLEQWIEVFDMQQDESGDWAFDRKQTRLWEHYDKLLEENRKLVRDWNKIVPKYNARIAPREMGRPIAASAAQRDAVLKRRKAGESLRTIAAATLLSLRTVRTILAKASGSDRATKRTNELRRREFDRLRAAAYRARKRARDALPKQITELQKSGAALVKAAKGMGRR
jgi:hypothetical protein